MSKQDSEEPAIDIEGTWVTELADYLDLSKSGVHNHLMTLEHLGYVVRDDVVFRPSLQFLQDGASIRRQHRLYRVAADEVNRLAKASGVAAGAFVLENDHVVCIYSAVDENVETSLLETGDVFPLHCTASGKAILAAFDDEEVERLVEMDGLLPYTDSTITDYDQLCEVLQRVRSRGLAFNREEYETDIREIGTDITDVDGQVLGAVGIACPTESMTGKRFQQNLPGLVIRSANRIENDILSP